MSHLNQTRPEAEPLKAAPPLPQPAYLARDEDLLRALMDNCTDHIYFKDLNSHFIRCSKAMCDRCETTVQDIVGKRDSDFFKEEHASEAYEDEQRIIRTGQPMAAKVEKEVWKKGEQSWVLTAKMPFRNKDNEIIGTLGISKDITAIKNAEAAVEKLHTQLLDASRMAGMAEVATSVLHNVGNVLNSVNVSSTVVSDKIRNSRVGSLAKVAALLQENMADLPGFFANNPKARQLPGYISELARHLEAERQDMLKELASMAGYIEHIKQIVTMQQNYARASGVLETLPVADLVEDAVRLNAGAIARHHVHIIRQFHEVPNVVVDKHKVLQILVNLIQNAKCALDQQPDVMDRTVILRIEQVGNDAVRVSVIDNGVGIPPENMSRIFQHGFTTRKGGHGFGLHSCALAAKDFGGTLAAYSEGPGKGARFTLDIPCQTNKP